MDSKDSKDSKDRMDSVDGKDSIDGKDIVVSCLGVRMLSLHKEI